jgi:hypothetical protein
LSELNSFLKLKEGPANSLTGPSLLVAIKAEVLDFSLTLIVSD